MIQCLLLNASLEVREFEVQMWDVHLVHEVEALWHLPVELEVLAVVVAELELLSRIVNFQERQSVEYAFKFTLSGTGTGIADRTFSPEYRS